MSLGRLVVTAVIVEGRSKSEVAREYGVSRRWVHELVARYQAEGETGLEPSSRRPHRSPNQLSADLEDEIVEIRKTLVEEGLDAGAHTIAAHLERCHGSAPAPSTIWRTLRRRGFVTPQPQKRPKSSYVRFEADQPNERWQAISPTGISPMEPQSRSSTSSTTTPGSWWHPTPTPPPKPPTWSPASMGASPGGDCPPRCSPTTEPSSPASTGAEAESPSRSNSPASESNYATPPPTTPRPAAKSNGSTRPSRNGYALSLP